MAERGDNGPVTARELQVLELMAQGLHTKLIARRLGIETVTVDAFRQGLYRKLGARGQVAVLVEGVRRGLVSITSDSDRSVVHVLGEAI